MMSNTNLCIQIPIASKNTEMAQDAKNNKAKNTANASNRKYLITSDQDRLRFFEEWANSQLTIKEVAKKCKIRYSTAKSIVRLAKTEQRICKKANRVRKQMPGISNFERVCGQNQEIARQLKAELSKGYKQTGSSTNSSDENSSNLLMQNHESTTELKNESSMEEIKLKFVCNNNVAEEEAICQKPQQLCPSQSHESVTESRNETLFDVLCSNELKQENDTHRLWQQPSQHRVYDMNQLNMGMLPLPVKTQY